ncbi:MAG TPA: hypothetical protein VK597_05030, partial [Inquilinus sp.]|nr:hypothetical protein [Inquilinus sp.]
MSSAPAGQRVTVCQKKKATTAAMMTHSKPMIRSICMRDGAFHSTGRPDRKPFAARLSQPRCSEMKILVSLRL